MRFGFPVKLLGVTMLVGLLSGAVFGRDVVVVLKNGRTIAGELVSDQGNTITVSVRGVPTPLSRDQIDSIKDAPAGATASGLTGAFVRERATLKNDDYDGRYKLCRKYFDQAEESIKQKQDAQAREAFTAVQAELEAILKDQPNLRSTVLLETVKDRLSNLKTAPVDPGAPVTPDKPDTEKPTTKAGDLLSLDDINLIKIYEVDLKAKIRTRKMSREGIDKLFANREWLDDPAMKDFQGPRGKTDFQRLEGTAQLSILFELRARELYNEVQIQDEPAELAHFRSKVHTTYVLTYCGSCHESGKARGLDLFTPKQHPRANPTQMAYSNLLILRRTKAGPYNLIETAAPDRSPLVTFGLPAADTTLPHPPVNGKSIRPFFRGASDPLVKEMVDWVSQIYVKPYPIGTVAEEEPTPAEPAN